MSGPWENYQSAAQTPPPGPWMSYAQEATPQQQAIASPAGRFATGILEPIMGMGQLAPRAVSEVASLGGNFPNVVSRAADASTATQDAGAKKLEGNYQDARTATGESGFDWMKLGGNMISPANAIIGGGAGMLPEATTLGARAAQGALVGSGYGAIQPDTSDNFGTEKAWQSGLGAVVGSGAPVAGEAMAKLISPKVSSDVQTLMNEGINLTPGQIAGGNTKALEDKLTSLPVIGGMVKNAQKRSMQDLNTAQANRALNPIGESLPASMNGREAVGYVKDTLGNAYDDILPKLTGANDPEFKQGIQGVRDMAAAPGALPPQQQATLNGVIDREISSRISPNGTISGQSLKDINTALNNKINDYKGAQDPYDKTVLGGLKEIQSQVRQMTTRTNPDYAPQLSAIDTGYANYARLRQAASSLGANEGTFTPAQLANAIKNGDKSVGHGDYATGRAFGQDLSDAAKSALPSKIPDTGTASRGGLMAALAYLAGGGGAAIMGHPLGAAAAAVPALGVAGLYTKTGQAMAKMLMTQRPQGADAVADAVRNISQPAVTARAAYLLNSR